MRTYDAIRHTLNLGFPVEDYPRERECSMQSQKYPNALKHSIKLLGYTLQEVADEVGIPRRTLTEYCAGRNPIPRKVVQQIAAVLGCSLEMLVPLYASSRPEQVLEVLYAQLA